MNDTYVEWMVKRKTSVAMNVIDSSYRNDWPACHGCF